MPQRRKIFRQPPLKGGRDPLFSCVLPEIRAAAVREAAQYHVSPSWVVATILSDYFGIKDQVSFKTVRKHGQFGLRMIRKEA